MADAFDAQFSDEVQAAPAAAAIRRNDDGRIVIPERRRRRRTVEEMAASRSAILDAIADHPLGLTEGKIREIVGLSRAQITETLTEIRRAGQATYTTRGCLWTPARTRRQRIA